MLTPDERIGPYTLIHSIALGGFGTRRDVPSKSLITMAGHFFEHARRYLQVHRIMPEQLRLSGGEQGDDLGRAEAENLAEGILALMSGLRPTRIGLA